MRTFATWRPKRVPSALRPLSTTRGRLPIGWPLEAMVMSMAKKIDRHDGDPWSEMDLDDMRAYLGRGKSIEWIARFLSRSGTIDDVKRKADELGLKYHSNPGDF
jgi:hypothetical protein